MADFDPETHPRAADGKFGQGGGSAKKERSQRARETMAKAQAASAARSAQQETERAAIAHASIQDRAASSIKDPAFIAEHQNRLIQAADHARGKYPRELQAHDEAHGAAQQAIHDEAARVLTEHAAAAGPHEQVLRQAASDSRTASARQGNSPEQQHQSALTAIQQNKSYIQEQQDALKNEYRAVAAGHVSTTPRDLVNAYVAKQQERNTANDHVAEKLDHAHAEAVKALSALHEYEHEGNQEHEGRDLEHTHGLTDQFGGVQSVVSAMTSHGDRDVSYDEHESHGHAHPEFPEHVPHPDHEDHEQPLTPEQHAQGVRDHEAYKAQVTAHEAEFKRRADVAQAALEHLYVQQTAAHEVIKANSKAEDREHQRVISKLEDGEEGEFVNSAAFSKHEQDENTGGFRDPKIEEAHRAAHDAERSMRDRALEKMADHAPTDPDDALGGLTESKSDTAKAIRELSRITGRKPNLGKRTKAQAEPDTE
jgi:hypothetical protein